MEDITATNETGTTETDIVTPEPGAEIDAGVEI